MRKLIVCSTAALLVVSMFCSMAAGLAYDVQQRPIEIVLDGKKIPFKDVRPIMYNNSTLVPLRVVSENLGAKVKWDGKTQTAIIEKEESTIQMKVNDSTAYINGSPKTFASKMVMHGSSTLVPIRFVSEALGAQVEFDKSAYYVQIYSSQYDKSTANVDPSGRLIRTTNLPKNASKYPYILQDIPNEMYEMPFYRFDYLKEQFQTPVELSVGLNRKNMDSWKKKIEENYSLVLNVDYNNIDYTWAKKVRSYWHILGDDRDMRDYVDWVKKNKIKIEGVLIAEPSMFYDDGFSFRMRSKFKFRILSFNKYKDIIFDSAFHVVKNEKGSLPGLYKKNVWYEGYADIMLGSNVDGAQYTPNLMLTSPSLFLYNSIIKESK